MVPSLDKIEVECYSGYRAAKEVASFYIELDNREQAELVQGLLERVDHKEGTDVAFDKGRSIEKNLHESASDRSFKISRQIN